MKSPPSGSVGFFYRSVFPFQGLFRLFLPPELYFKICM